MVGTIPGQVIVDSISKLRKQWEVSQCFSVISASVTAFMVFLEFLSWLPQVIDNNQLPCAALAVGSGPKENVWNWQGWGRKKWTQVEGE